MTISVTDSHKATAANQENSGKMGAFGAAFQGLINQYRETRKTNKSRPLYHNHKEIQLERAQQDVNRLWRGQI